jgi:transcriptional regulator with XRE-family HTH domain
MANNASWTNVYKRINAKRIEANLTWRELCSKSGVRMSTWMTGLPISHPTDEEIRKIAPVVNSTYAYLRYGITDLSELE